MTTSKSVEPVVSVVITTYFRNEYLRACLESVCGQVYDNIEILVVDDSGENHAESICDEYDVQYIGFDTNKGQNVARNRGLEAINGKYVQILDDDDQLRPTKIKKQVSLLERRENTGVVYCGREMESGYREFPDPEVRGQVLDAILTMHTSPCLTSTMLIDAVLLEEIFPIREYDAMGDLPLKIELARRTEFDYIDELLVFAGEPETSMGTSWANIECRWLALEDYADLYADRPDWVRRAAIADTYQKSGRRRLEERTWSWRAIADFTRVLVYDPNRRLRDVLELGVSLGGRPTYRLSQKVADALA